MRYLFIFFVLSLSVNAACVDYAQNFTEVSIPNGIPYSNERVNMYVAGEYFGSIIVQDRVVTSLQCEMISDATYNVYVASEDVLSATYDSVEDVLGLVDDGSVTIEPQTFVSNVKYTLSKLALKMVSWFW